MMISVVIPSYNCSHTIKRAIESALHQTCKDIQIIVVDDCSSDNTLDVLKHYTDNVTVIKRSKRGGAAAARNTGVNAAEGEYIAFLDANDEWMEAKLELQLDIMERSQNRPGLVTCNSSWIGLDQSTPLVKDYYSTHQPHSGERVWVNLLKQNFIPTPTVLTRTDVLKVVGGFDETLPIGEDRDLWIRIARKFRVEYRKEILVKFYERSGSLMKEYSKDNMDLTLQLTKKHIDENRAYLQQREIDNILGHRLHGYAYEAYIQGDYMGSIALCKKSFSHKYRLIKNMILILRCLYRKQFSKGQSL